MHAAMLLSRLDPKLSDGNLGWFGWLTSLGNRCILQCLRSVFYIKLGSESGCLARLASDVEAHAIVDGFGRSRRFMGYKLDLGLEN